MKCLQKIIKHKNMTDEMEMKITLTSKASRLLGLLFQRIQVALLSSML